MRSVTQVRAVPHLLGRQLDLAWQNPPASEFASGTTLAGIALLRNERTFPLLREDGVPIYGEVAYGEQTATGRIDPGPVVSQFSDRGLEPLTTYYYTIYAVDNSPTPSYFADEDSRVAAFTTERFHLADRLYKLLPAIHQRYDSIGLVELARMATAILDALDDLPPGLRGRGPLWRFFHATASPLDLMRSFAEGLPQLHDVDLARSEFLPLLAHWIGWQPDHTLPVFAQRSEIKFAPRFYRTVGTVTNLRAVVNRHTGWHAQVAEFAQHITRSNLPPQLNLFSIVEEAGGCRGTDDAAPILGFGVGNNEATGAGSVPAILVSTAIEPFALRPGMEFAIVADHRIPVAVRFHSGDFADIGNARGLEVAAVLSRELSEAIATARTDGRIVLQSNTVGPDSSLRVEQYAASLVTLEGAPRGRLTTFTDSGTRVRLFYGTADPLAPALAQAAAHALSGRSFPTGLLPGERPQPPVGEAGMPPSYLPSRPQGRVRYKTFRAGTWGGSHPLTEMPDAPQGDPAAVELTDGRVWVAWIDNPNASSARLRFMVGTARSAQPASLAGKRSAPFSIAPGTHLLFKGNWAESEGFEFAASDFADAHQASAIEVSDALNARLSHVVASLQANNTILLETAAAGGDEQLEIDLKHSSAAQALGFDSGNSQGTGDWGDAIDWLPPRDVSSAAPGRHSDLNAIVDTTGTLWLFWAMHAGSNWQIVTSRWDGSTWSPVDALADGAGGNREPDAVLDANGSIWLFWARRQGVSTHEDIWTLRRRVFDPGTSTWDSETAVTTVPLGGRATDREPGVARLASGDLRVFFRSDRAGGIDLWSVTVTPPAGAVGAPAAMATDPFADHDPSPVLMPDGALWLVYRSDRSVPLSRVATRPLPTADNRILSPALGEPSPPRAPSRSLRMPDTGTLCRYAGATSVVLSDAARIGRRRQWDDLLSYTPEKPLGLTRGEVLQDDDLYTRGTVGLYLSQVIVDSPLSRQMVERLRPVLERFLPINVRAVVILAPRVDIEFAYRPGADIEESYLDKHPTLEYYTGLGDSAAAVLPDWVVLISNTLGHVSVDPADPATLRRRTHFSPPL